jgi:sodium transport system permease protein
MSWLTIFLKEVRENLRDRRTMMTTFVVSPLMGPVLFAVIMGLVLSLQKSRMEKPLEIPIIGQQHAPNFIEFLKQSGVKVKKAPENPEAEIRDRNSDVIFRISSNFSESWNAGEPAEVEMLFDPSRQSANTAIARANAVIETYSRKIGALRLTARGINPSVTTALAVKRTDLSTPEARSSMVLGMLPYLMFFTIFLGGMSMAIDATAGERERQSLEALLINPLSRAQVMFGKVMTSAAFACCSTALTLIIYAIGFKFVPLEQFGMKLALTFPKLVLIFVLLIPLAFIASAAQTTLAAFSKSFREAQSQVSLLMLIPGIPSMLMMVNPIKPLDWYYAVPFFGHHFLIEGIVRNEPISWLHIGLATASAILVAGLLMLVAARMYQRESLAISA